MKIALCFWGLTRSLKYTIDSIKNNILEILDSHNIEYKIFVHTFKFDSEYKNPRANEVNVKLNFEEYTLLNADYIEIDDQDKVKTDIDVFKYRKQNDPWNSDYICVDNFLCAMYSKKRIGQMVENSGEEFEYIVYLRPDMKYHTKFDVRYFSHANQYTVCTPDFHLFPNLNDRFCILTTSNLTKYYSIFDKIYSYSLVKPLHSEQFQYHIFTNDYKWTVHYISFLFNRVRATGVELNDSGIPLDENKVKQKVKNTRKILNTPIQLEGYNKIKPMFKRVIKNTTNEWSL